MSTTVFDNLQHGVAASTRQSPPMIYDLLSQVSEAVGAIGKTKRNEQQGFMFRGIDDFLNEVHPALVRHRVVVIPEVLDRWCDIRPRADRKTGEVVGVTVHTVLTIRYTFYAPDGSSVSAVVVGEGADTADKSHNKALSAAFKYLLIQSLCIPLADMADADKTTPDMGGAGPALMPSASKIADRVSKAKLDVRRDALSHAITTKLDADGKANLRAFCKEHDIPNVVAKMTEDQMSEVEGFLVLLGDEEGTEAGHDEAQAQADDGAAAAEGAAQEPLL